MRIAIFGAGAIGSVVGGLLSVKNDVTLVCRDAHALAINKEGLSIEGKVQGRFHPRAVTSSDEVGTQDVVFITVKAYDTPKAVQLIEPLVGGKTLVISLQNGLRNKDILTSRYGDRAVASFTFMGVTMLSPGRVRLAGTGETVMESGGSRNREINRAADALREAGLDVRTVRDIGPEMWLKAIVNASINPITALVRKTNRCIVEEDDLAELSRLICEEGARAAAAKGVELPIDHPFERVLRAARETALNRSSMLMDVESGRPTEIEELNGEIARAGEEFGIDMTYNRIMLALVKSAAPSR